MSKKKPVLVTGKSPEKITRSEVVKAVSDSLYLLKERLDRIECEISKLEDEKNNIDETIGALEGVEEIL